MSISDQAMSLHRQMLARKSSGEIYGQTELLELAEMKNIADLMILAQELINQHLIKLSTRSGELYFQAVASEEANKVKGMNTDESMIYSHIESSGREGIWSKTIRARTNLHQTIVQRCLKNLENQRYIKVVKSVKFPTRKIYMLFNLQPSIEVSGGPWFTDSELDTEFIESLQTVVWRFVAQKSYPNAFGGNHNRNQGKIVRNINIPLQQTYPSNYAGYATVSEIQEFIMNSRITTVDLSANDIRALCEVLVFDDKFERWNGGHTYKATWHSLIEAGGGGEAASLGDIETLDGFSEVPCSKCVNFDFCEGPGSKQAVNVADCIYLDEWLV